MWLLGQMGGETSALLGPLLWARTSRGNSISLHRGVYLSPTERGVTGGSAVTLPRSLGVQGQSKDLAPDQAPAPSPVVSRLLLEVQGGEEVPAASHFSVCKPRPSWARSAAPFHPTPTASLSSGSETGSGPVGSLGPHQWTWLLGSKCASPDLKEPRQALPEHVRGCPWGCLHPGSRGSARPVFSQQQMKLTARRT